MKLLRGYFAENKGLQNNKALFTAAMLLLVLFFSGCEVIYEAPYEPNYIRASEIEVTGEFDHFGSALEVEIHIIEANTNRFIACAGNHHGLERVDSSDYFYEIDALFETPLHNDYLTYEDIEGLDIYLLVFEDDEAECPGPFIWDEDDMIGVSRVFRGEDLYRMRNFSFDDVVHLRMGS